MQNDSRNEASKTGMSFKEKLPDEYREEESDCDKLSSYAPSERTKSI